MILNQLLDTVFNIKRPRFMKFECNAMRPIFPLSYINCCKNSMSLIDNLSGKYSMSKTSFCEISHE